MNISGINMYNLSFGQVHRDAARKAIDEAGHQIDKLKKIKNLVEEQKDNTLYDITEDSKTHRFKIVRNAENNSAVRDEYCDSFEISYSDNFEAACAIAAYNKMVEDILADCKE